MNLSEPTKLGILACPGGEHFADQVIRRLGSIYKRRFDRKTQLLAGRYHITEELVTRKMNFNNDVQSSLPFIPGNVNGYRSPSFKIHARHTYFPNGEVKTEILDSVRGKDVYIFQDIENHQPLPFNEGAVHRVLSVNDHLFSLFVTIDAAIQAGAARINLVLPSYPYARQHKKKGRESLTAARVSEIFENLGVERVITLDIHSREIENSFGKMRLENLQASLQVIEKLIELTDISSDDLVVLSPDTGAVDRNKFYVNSLHRPLALLYKERDYSKVTKNAAESNITDMKLLGDVDGKTVFMADDMLGTGGTLLKGMRTIREMGARSIICAVSLPLFSGSAIEDFDAAYHEGLFHRIIATNAVFHRELLQKEWYVQADCTGLFAQIISLVHHNRSLSSMLDPRDLVAKRIKRQLDRIAHGHGGKGLAAAPPVEAPPPRLPSRAVPCPTRRPSSRPQVRSGSLAPGRTPGAIPAMQTWSLPPRAQALLFDLDSTLYTNAAYARFQNEVLIERLAVERGETLAETQALLDDRRAELGAATSLGRLFLSLGIATETSVLWREELIRPGDWLEPDPLLVSCLSQLTSSMRLALVTNNPKRLGRESLAALGVADFFEEVIGLDDSGHSKPDPASFALAAARLGLSAGLCVSIGDRYEVDILPALSLGMGGILIKGVEEVYELANFFLTPS